MTIRHWPATERPREKLLTKGADTLSDAELLAIFLRTGCAGKSAVDLARELLNQFGHLRALFSANQVEFCRARGLGLAKYAQLQAVLEMARRHWTETLRAGPALTSSHVVKDYVRAQLRHEPREVFAALFLDSQHRLLEWQPLSHGTLDAAAVYPREVARTALDKGAGAVIFAHNHPSGHPEPSRCDIDITHTLKEALGLFEIRVLDHVIVGENQVYSLAEHGHM